MSMHKAGFFNDIKVFNQIIKTRSLPTVYPGEEPAKGALFYRRSELPPQKTFCIHWQHNLRITFMGQVSAGGVSVMILNKTTLLSTLKKKKKKKKVEQ